MNYVIYQPPRRTHMINWTHIKKLPQRFPQQAVTMEDVETALGLFLIPKTSAGLDFSYIGVIICILKTCKDQTIAQQVFDDWLRDQGAYKKAHFLWNGYKEGKRSEKPRCSLRALALVGRLTQDIPVESK